MNYVVHIRVRGFSFTLGLCFQAYIYFLYFISEMQMHVCYYCGIKFDNIAGVVEHCQGKHQHNVLKYRQLIHDEHSGILKYQLRYTKE